MKPNNNQYIINSKKQSNGLWGMPLQCIFMDKIPIFSDENLLKHSAFCIAIAEIYKDETFEIRVSNDSGFCIGLSKSGWKRFNYNDYKLTNNVLTYEKST